MGAYNNGVLGFSEVGGRLLAENPTKVERRTYLVFGNPLLHQVEDLLGAAFDAEGDDPATRILHRS